MACCVPCFPLAVMRASLDDREMTVTDLLCVPTPYANRQVRRLGREGFVLGGENLVKEGLVLVVALL